MKMNKMKNTCVHVKMEKFSVLYNSCINEIVLEQGKCKEKHRGCGNRCLASVHFSF